MRTIFIPIEYLHLATGYLLIFSGICSYFLHGIETLLSWCIFGFMYISMSDIGENCKCREEIRSVRHRNRRIKGYLGLLFSVFLFVYYLFNNFLIYA